MTLAAVLDRSRASLGEALPGLIGAVVLLVVGLIVAAIVGSLVRRALRAVALDAAAERYGAHAALARIGLEGPLSSLLGRVVRIGLSIIVIVAAVSLLGLGALSEALNEIVLFLPKLFVALVLVLVGFVLAQFVDDWVRRMADQMALDGPLPQLAQAAVFTLFLLTALAQLGIATSILTAIVGVLLVAAAFTVALSFGLGGRDVARQLSAGRYVRGAFTVGQRISAGAVTGEIIGLERAATLVRTDGGDTVRLPNQLLVDSVVTVHGGDER